MVRPGVSASASACDFPPSGEESSGMSPVTVRERYGDRLFNPRRVATELPRLSALAGMHDADTFRCLSTLGVSSGWCCLDVGAGPGYVARWLATAVGPAGTVTAMDRDTRMLRGFENPSNLEQLDADILAEASAPASFDLVHCRTTLMHIPQRAELLARLASWVRPGRWL